MLHISFGLTAYILCITFFLGCCLGSFADCLAMRLLSGESAFAGRSHCDSCGHVLGAPDLVPLFSWLFLKGRCRYCGAKVPAECFFTELLAGIGCCMVVIALTCPFQSLRGVLLGLILLTMALTDLHGWIIPDPAADCGLSGVSGDGLLFAGTGVPYTARFAFRNGAWRRNAAVIPSV